MRTRTLGRTGAEVSEVGLGAWAMGGDWGDVDDDESLAALHAAVDAGVTFIDTADVYGDGHSEKLIGRFLDEREEDVFVATKMGRRSPFEEVEDHLEQFRAWVDRSRDNLGMERLDLVQLHCVGPGIYDDEAVWDALDQLVDEGRIAAYGVSVETVDRAMRAIERPNLATVQIIFNMFRMKPADAFLDAAAEANVGVIVRVPLASGLLTGKYDRDATFPQDDHRNFNRDGEAFDVGETFAGVDFETGLEAVDRLRPLVPDGATMAQLALKWVLMHDAVSTVIPGAKNPKQARANAAASDLAPLDDATMTTVREVYDELVGPRVQHRW